MKKQQKLNLNQPLTLSQFNKALSVFSKKLDGRFKQIDGRFEQIDGRFEQIDGRFEQIDGRFKQIDDRFEQIDDRFKQIDGRFKQIDDRFIEVDTRFKEIGGWFQAAQSIHAMYTDRAIRELENRLSKKFDIMMSRIDKFLDRAETNERETTFLGRQHDDLAKYCTEKISYPPYGRKL